MRGIVHRLPDRLKNWGFIRAINRQGLPIGDEYFFHSNEDVIADAIGRTHLQAGDLVEFEPSLRRDKLVATDVWNLAAESIDSQTHREWSVIVTWLAAERSVPAQAWLARDAGDSLVLFPGDIVDFEALEPHLRTDLWVYHGVRKSAGCGNNAGRFHAVYAQIYVPRINDEEFVFVDSEPQAEPEMRFAPGSVEQMFLSAPELPIADCLKPLRKPGEIYCPSEKKLTLRQLIAARKKTAA